MSVRCFSLSAAKTDLSEGASGLAGAWSGSLRESEDGSSSPGSRHALVNLIGELGNDNLEEVTESEHAWSQSKSESESESESTDEVDSDSPSSPNLESMMLGFFGTKAARILF